MFNICGYTHKSDGDEMNFVQDENHIIINANRETVK